ncbi:efflux transporter periplasmic adaptor subunit, partial [Burkholderia cepacia]|nr:efflux transporter periplasmic adaptor subunit [Burkholderia cepacia]
MNDSTEPLAPLSAETAAVPPVARDTAPDTPLPRRGRRLAVPLAALALAA